MSQHPLAEHVRRRSGHHERRGETNVGELERMASVAAGFGLAVYGLTRRTLGGFGLAVLGGTFVYRGITGHCACYDALGFSTAESLGPQASIPAQHGVRVEETITVRRPREELFRYWRDLSNLPRVMSHLKSVETRGDRHSHWVASGPLGINVEWDAEIITERENELIGWRSVGDSDVDTAGSVHFTQAPGGEGTEVRVLLKYDPPAGKVGDAINRLLGESPAQQIREDLQRYKQALETQSAHAHEGGRKGR